MNCQIIMKAITSVSLYDKDYYLWLKTTINKLQNQQFKEIDVNHLIEELEALGRTEKKALRSYLRLIVMHLLKWQYQPNKRSKSWKITIRNNRFEVEESLEDNPSLRTQLSEFLEQCYPRARVEASDETGLSIAIFPVSCPFTLEQILDNSFLPD